MSTGSEATDGSEGSERTSSSSDGAETADTTAGQETGEGCDPGCPEGESCVQDGAGWICSCEPDPQACPDGTCPT